MNRFRRRGPLTWWIGLGVAAATLIVVVRHVDAGALRSSVHAAAGSPLMLTGVLAAYAAAFGLRAVLWRRVLPELGLRDALSAIHVSLGANHILPLRLGESLRVASVAARTNVPASAAATSTILLRAADVLALLGIALVLAPRTAAPLLGPWGWVAAGVCVAAAIGGATALVRLARAKRVNVRLPGLSIALGSAAAWVLEAGVLWQAARWAGIEIDPVQAIAVTAVTIAAQVFAVAPGGFGTYEAAATAAMVSLGADPGAALAAALTAHALKTIYALVTGAACCFWPAPGIFGRLRLPVTRSAAPVQGESVADGPVVLFLPARDEESAVAAVVRRVPSAVCGREVRCVVVDDRSSDATAARAAAAGAEVVRTAGPGGLGAAVRRGLQEAVRLNASAVAFCDADGEYAPEELSRLVAPILRGEADYVIGSRFAGDIQRMLRRRRAGNRVLTRAFSWVARHRVSDAQSGFRALSPQAARSAQVIHDFNYAQVLTLDLLAKGFRYAEVPISYRFRTTGRSFVKLVPYLRNVIPAMHRELNNA